MGFAARWSVAMLYQYKASQKGDHELETPPSGDPERFFFYAVCGHYVEANLFVLDTQVVRDSRQYNSAEYLLRW